MRRAGTACIILSLIPLAGSLGSRSPSAAEEYRRIELPSSPNPVGSGARALGMGGAFIAMADDATAASWNPGGLVQLERPEVSVVGAYFSRNQDNTFELSPETSGTETVSKARVNYLSAVYPFAFLQRNMVAALTYQNLFDLTGKWNFVIQDSTSGTQVLEEAGVEKHIEFSRNQAVTFRREGSLSAWGASCAVQFTRRLSWGVTFNAWADGLYDNGWQLSERSSGSGMMVVETGPIGGPPETRSDTPFLERSRHLEDFSFSGFNVNIGFLFALNGNLTLGGVFKSPFRADLDFRGTVETSRTFPGNGAPIATSGTAREKMDLDMPMAYGIGIAYRRSDRLSFSADIYRTEWDDFVLKDAEGNEISPISGKPSREADIDPTTQVRLGGEYLVFGEKYVFPVRAGLFYDPAPAEHSPDDFYGVSVGSGITTARFSFDVSYQYRFARDIGGSILQNLGFSQDVTEHTVYSSLIVYF